MNIEDTTKLNLILTKDIDNIETEEGLNELKDRIYKALSLDLRLFNEKQLSSVSIRTKKALKPKYSLGDIFQIYLNKEKVYSYAMCVKEERPNEDIPYHIFAFFDFFPKKEASLQGLEEQLISDNVLMLSHCGVTGVLNGEWQKVTSMQPLYYDFSKIEYVSKEDGGVLRPSEITYYKSIGNPNNGEFIKIDYEEAKKNK
ncbi:Imm26 family immunity protein [Listeria cossartiae]|uniref:Imm26 family immunity protein n=1 Tax=Listeria cossartiae TaxID=2838249 RepID=UPI0021AE0AC1|nr:Imm26 family immunity protein [Listeria cossartiae]